MGSLSDAQALIPVQTSVTGTSTLVTNLTPGTTYFFKVKAVNATGISAPTNEASATPVNPSPPTGVTASAGVARVALSWTASQDAMSYNVFMGTASGAQSSVPVATGLAGTSVTITSLTPNVNYFFTVRSIAYSAASNASSEVSATPTTAPPPANLSAAAGVGSAALTWTASSTATSYNVYMGTSSAGQSPTPIQSGLTGTGTTISGLDPSTRYYFVVRSVVSGVAGSASNEAAVTPLPTPVPQNLTAVAGFGQIGLGWTAAATATSYNVYSGGCPLGQPANATLSGVTGVSATIPNLTPGVQYCFTVRAVGPAGMSAPAAEVSATPQRYPGPANLVATPGVGQVALAWAASPSATAYDVYMGSSAGQQGTSPVQTVSGTTATVTGLSSPNTYYFVVVAQTPIGASLRSAEVSARPLVPPGPTNLVANPDRGQVSLTWSAAANAQSYSVFMGATSGGQSATPVQTGITGLSTIVAGLTSNNNYFFFVRAETASGPSQNSNEVSARPLAPVGPTGLAATPGQNQVALTWNPVAAATSYSVYVGTSSGGQSTTPTLTNLLGTSGTVTGLTNGSNYFFVVRAETSGGLSAPSNEVSATPVAPPSPPPSSNSGGGGGGGAFDLLTLLALTLAGIVGAFVRTSPRRDP
jgi:fibronectin type 3 domain-containing protein